MVQGQALLVAEVGRLPWVKWLSLVPAQWHRGTWTSIRSKIVSLGVALPTKPRCSILGVSTLGDSVPLASAEASTDAEWKQWALAVFGGNEARATAAAQAAAAARTAGATSDALFAPRELPTTRRARPRGRMYLYLQPAPLEPPPIALYAQVVAASSALVWL